MLKKRDQGRSNGDDLRRCNIDVIDLVRCRKRKLVLITAGNKLIHQYATLADTGIGLGYNELEFINRRQILDFVCHALIGDLSVGRFKKAIFVSPRVDSK